MSGRARSRSKSKQRKGDRGSKQHAGMQQPRERKAKQKQAPPEKQDIKPDQDKEGEGAPVAQGGDLKADLQKMPQDLQKMPQAKAEPRPEYHPDVKGTDLPFVEPIKKPEAGKEEPQI